MESARQIKQDTQRLIGRGERFDLDERLLAYAGSIIRVVDSLKGTAGANHVGGQLLRSGTSPLPNHGEAEAAESRRDFVHKLKICLKELRESRRWLKLIQRADLSRDPDPVAALIQETEELIKIFYASIRTAQRNADQKDNVTPGSYRLREDVPWKLDVECSLLGVEVHL